MKNKAEKPERIRAVFEGDEWLWSSKIVERSGVGHPDFVEFLLSEPHLFEWRRASYSRSKYRPLKNAHVN